VQTEQLQRFTFVAPVSRGGRATVNFTWPQWHWGLYIFFSGDSDAILGDWENELEARWRKFESSVASWGRNLITFPFIFLVYCIQEQAFKIN